MRMIRYSAVILFFSLAIITVSALSHIREARAASSASIVAASAIHADGNGGGVSRAGDVNPASRYFPGPTETLLFGIALLVGGGLLRRRRRPDED
jgi:hypothetical protein